MLLKCSIGVIAFNEEKNIGNLLQSLLNQKLKKVVIDEILVIISGSTDSTKTIARRFANINKRIKIVIQRERLGKVSAINLFIGKSRNKILVLASADIVLTDFCLEKLVSPLLKGIVGMTGVHPIPVNTKDHFMGFTAYVYWRLFHLLSLQKPKMGEMVAFKKIFERIPPLSNVDEPNIEPLIYGQGYSLVYVPEAVVYNRGPETIGDYLLRSRRVYAGERAMLEELGYKVSSFSYPLLFKSVLKFLRELIKNESKETKLRYLFWTPAVIILEAYGRLLGFYDYKILKKRSPIWEITYSAKKESVNGQKYS